MTVFKVVRRVRGKLYSAIIKKLDSRQGVTYRKYGRFWTKRPRGGGPLLSFNELSIATQFAKSQTAGKDFEIWEAGGEETKQPIRKPLWFPRWPTGTVFCDAIRLKRRIPNDQ